MVTMMMMMMMMMMLMMKAPGSDPILSVQQGTAFLDVAMAGTAPEPGPRPSDDNRRRWFVQDFAATSLADGTMELPLAVDCIQRMERALRARSTGQIHV